MAHDAGGWIDREAHDLLRRVMRDVLDVDAAFGRNHERDFAGFAVDQDREIELPIDVGAFLDVEAGWLLSLCAGLGRPPGGAHPPLCEFLSLLPRPCASPTPPFPRRRLLA